DLDTSTGERSKGFNLLSALARDFPRTQVFIVGNETHFPTQGMQGSRYQRIQRPLDEEELCTLINSSLQNLPESGRASFPPEASVPLDFEGIVAISLPMRAVIQRIMEATSSDIPVLITGETGTGKDLAAAAIHKRSKRKDRPYIVVNTGAMTPQLIASELFGHEKGAYTGAMEQRPGLFEQAHGGTIFLDEISTMDEKAQVSLLRVLEDGTFRRVGGEKDVQVDVRVIAATNENLEEAVKNRRFREDLYYRLDVFRIHLPPLRDRPGSVTLLTNHFVSHFAPVYKKTIRVISPQAYRCLRRYSWPGNVRELKNVIQRAILMAKGEELTPDLIPGRIMEATQTDSDANRQMSPIHAGMTLDAVEKEFIAMTLASTGGNKKEAALRLGISRRALYNKLQKHGT
ncbi:MAG: sigma-54 interaction domain-containing protein, partial [Candidatus Binatia bacterium]